MRATRPLPEEDTEEPLAGAAGEPTATPVAARRTPWPVRAALAVLAALLAAGAVGIGTGLLTGEPVGAADNGDGVRLYCGAGIVPDTPTGTSNWKSAVVLDFTAGAEPCPDPVPSSSLWLLRAAVGDADGPWSLTELGWWYLAAAAGVAALGAWAASARHRAGALVVLPALLPLADAGFSRFFHSTYGEPAGLLGACALLVGAGAVAVTRREDVPARLVALGLLAGGGFLAATAKTAYAPLIAVAAACCIVTAVGPRAPRRWLSHVVGPVLAVAVLLAAVSPVQAGRDWQARRYAAVNTHNVVFTLLLPEVGPQAATAVGLPAEAARISGRGYYPDGPAGVPGADLIDADPNGIRNEAWKVLAENPLAVLRALGVAMQATKGHQLDYLPAEKWTPGTRPLPAGPPAGEQAADREAMLGWLDGMARPWWPSLLALLGIAAGLASFRLRSALPVGLTRTAGIAAASAVGLALVAVVGDGYFEIAKHVWLPAYLLDVSLVALVAAVLAAAGARVRDLLAARRSQRSQ